MDHDDFYAHTDLNHTVQDAVVVGVNPVKFGRRQKIAFIFLFVMAALSALASIATLIIVW